MDGRRARAGAAPARGPEDGVSAVRSEVVLDRVQVYAAERIEGALAEIYEDA